LNSNNSDRCSAHHVWLLVTGARLEGYVMVALLGYSAWMLTLTAAYLALPGLSVAFLCLLAASVAGVIVVRVARCRPAQKLPWLLLAAAVFCFGSSRLTLVAGAERPQIPSWDAYTSV